MLKFSCLLFLATIARALPASCSCCLNSRIPIPPCSYSSTVDSEFPSLGTLAVVLGLALAHTWQMAIGIVGSSVH